MIFDIFSILWHSIVAVRTVARHLLPCRVRKEYRCEQEDFIYGTKSVCRIHAIPIFIK